MLRLKELRNEKGYNQQNLADMMHVSRSSIAMWERGTEPGNEALKKLSDIFSVSVDYLLGRSDTRNPSVSAPISVPTAPALSPDEARLLDLFRALNAQGRQMAVTTLESFAANPALTQDTTSARAKKIQPA